ncbi:MAG: histidine kinase [Clostridium argentinense]|uniref:Histidine kinase n=1 Tax=Clostridium faecium TaxID=2762223 RepID=A0ABR8YP96_9CLOT|nr:MULTISPECIES: LytS/YhcK type 5TM receptor domain-containing protein [Clostridium]MBD8046053.1 histidine kinase [Clostridium faecium]MBS5822979.1 histidine kinase [Clostridium argentinense]MDU1349769.1 LytS/YhcK type 5TM receptor domain-containing protein [Clostridium argentinense]
MLYIELLQRMSLIALSAYLFTRMKTFKNIIQCNTNKKDKLLMILFFSFLSMIGNYLGIAIVDNALANIRPIGVIISGYIGGPIVGTVVALIAGWHRYTFGGFTALACAIASFFEAMTGYLFSKKLSNYEFSIRAALYSGVCAEIIQFAIVLLIAKPFEKALLLEKIIILPMVLINTLGVVIFIAILKDVKNDLLNSETAQTFKALRIAKQASYYMKNGFESENVEKFIDEIHNVSNILGIFISNEEEFLGRKNINIEKETLNNWIKLLIESDILKYKLFFENNDIQKKYPIIISPIRVNNKYRGSVGIKIKSKYEIENYFNLCEELSDLLSNEIKIYELNKLAQQAMEANYKALIVQIHPHFLFNSLATIASLCRTNPEKARSLILELSNYFRTTLKRNEDFISLEEELDFLTSYLNIERARFGERLSINIDIEDGLSHIKVPVFILQPLIENAIKHGILPKIEGGTMNLIIKEKEDNILFSVKDDGVGMSENKVKNILLYNNDGIGMKNVNERLKLLYGDKSKLNIKSALNEGTTVYFQIPKERL